jgi:hypothetical protein
MDHVILGQWKVPLNSFPQGVVLRETVTNQEGESCYCVMWSEAELKKLPEENKKYDVVRCGKGARCLVCKPHYKKFEQLTTPEERKKAYTNFHTAPSFDQLCADSRSLGFSLFQKSAAADVRDATRRDSENIKAVLEGSTDLARARAEREDSITKLATDFQQAMAVEDVGSPPPLGYKPTGKRFANARQLTGSPGQSASSLQITDAQTVDQHAKCEAKYVALENQFSTLQKKHTELQAAHDRALESEQSLARDHDTLQRKVSSVEKQLVSSKRLNEQCEAEDELKSDRIDELEAKVEALLAKLSNLEQAPAPSQSAGASVVTAQEALPDSNSDEEATSSIPGASQNISALLLTCY